MLRLASVLIVAAAVLAAPAAAVPADFRAKADALLNRSFAADAPGATVVVTQDGRTVYSAARGRSPSSSLPLQS